MQSIGELRGCPIEGRKDPGISDSNGEKEPDILLCGRRELNSEGADVCSVGTICLWADGCSSVVIRGTPLHHSLDSLSRHPNDSITGLSTCRYDVVDLHSCSCMCLCSGIRGGRLSLRIHNTQNVDRWFVLRRLEILGVEPYGLVPQAHGSGVGREVQVDGCVSVTEESDVAAEIAHQIHASR